MELKEVKIEKPEEINMILGQSHFIKTVEDLYEIIMGTIPGAKFGIAFNEASGPCLVRHTGTDKDLEKLAVRNMENIGAGHVFVIFVKGFYPINVLNQIKACQEVARIFCATANPSSVIVAENEEGRGVLGVIDGFSPKGVETDEDISKRKELLRTIGYKQ